MTESLERVYTVNLLDDFIAKVILHFRYAYHF